MTIWGSFWFWLVLLSIVGLAVTFLVIQENVPGMVPTWVWYVYGLSLLLLLIAFILFCVQSTRPVMKYVTMDKCGRPVEVAPPCSAPITAPVTGPITGPVTGPVAAPAPIAPVTGPALPLLLPQPPLVENKGDAFSAAYARL